MSSDKKFIKYNSNKLRYDLIPPSTLKELAKTLTYGSIKYEPDNWRKCKDKNVYIAALYRHLEQWRSGEKKDEESGLSHLSHAITNIAFLIELFEDE